MVSEDNASVGYVYDENTPLKAAVHDDDPASVLSPSMQRKDFSDFSYFSFADGERETASFCKIQSLESH